MSIPTYTNSYSQQNQGYYNNYYTSTPAQNYYNNAPIQNYYNNPTPNTYFYTYPTRVYRAGSSIFPNVYQIYRALSSVPSGIKMTLTSPDYSTMRYLQSYYFTGLFSDFSGVSISISNIPGGVEVTVTSGSTSTVEQIGNIGYALVYQ
jgi:hypothetical protein